MFEEAIQIGFVEVSPFAKSRVVELLSGMQIGGRRGASLRKIEGCRVAFCHADWGGRRGEQASQIGIQ